MELRHPEEECLENKAWCWSNVPVQSAPPCQRSLHTGVVLESSLYVFGGYDGVQRTNDFFKFCFKTMKWSQIRANGVVPSPRDRHVAVVNKRCVYIYGGYDGNNRVNDFYEYNVDSNTWRELHNSGTSPSARHSHAGVVYEGSMYIFAGYDGLYRNDFHRYDFATKTWSVVNDSLGVNEHWPKPRYRTTVTVVGDQMVVFGGHDGARQLNDFYAWSFGNESWTEIEMIGSPPSPRDSHVAVAYKNSLFIFGGSTGNARSDFYEYKFEEQRWIPVVPTGGTPPTSRFCHIGVTHSKCFYVFGGYDGASRLNDFKQFRFETEVSDVPESTLTAELEDYVNSDKFSDISLVVEGKAIPAHKVFLCRSKYFSAMFSHNMKESASTEVRLSNISYNSMLTVLKYLYTDQVEVTLDNAQELLFAADMFCIERLKKLCEQKILDSIDVENAASILEASDAHGASNLREASLRFILTNFDRVSKTHSFNEMARANIELVLEILALR